MRIGENLEVRLSSSGKTFQIVSTGGYKDFVVASITRDIGDQLFRDENTYKALCEAFESLRDSISTPETRRNEFIASKQAGELYRETPFSKVFVESEEVESIFL
mgnify:CR=1 FL=1